MTKRPPDTIADADIRQALERSGYLLEARTAATLRRRGFAVLTSPPYEDPDSGKSRETDTIARTRTPLRIPNSTNEHSTLTTELVIECVHPPQPIAFFTSPVSVLLPKDRYPLAYARVVGWPRHVPSTHLELNWDWIWGHLNLNDQHHFMKRPAATQYCSFEQKKADREWFLPYKTRTCAEGSLQRRIVLSPPPSHALSTG